MVLALLLNGSIPIEAFAQTKSCPGDFSASGIGLGIGPRVIELLARHR
jgi:hypothetical protein